jgi:hypothetical protein
MSILHACCQLAGNGRWQVALSFSGLGMCGVIYIDIWIGLSNLMLALLHTERRSGFMKWLCNFLKGPKPGEPNRRRPQVTAGEEEDALWHQRPVRPKVLLLYQQLSSSLHQFISPSLSTNGPLIYPNNAVSQFSHPIQLHLSCLRLPFFAVSRMIHLEMTTKKWTVQLQSLSQRTSEPPKVLG